VRAGSSTSSTRTRASTCSRARRTSRSGRSPPDGPERAKRFLDYFFAEDADEEWIAAFLAYDDEIGREDTAFVESVHRGMRSGLVDRGLLLPESEQLVAAFQAWVAEKLEADA